MSKIEVNTVAPQCGTTLTLGESGDTVTLGSGASQSGFGRTGTVDWQTSIKTATFTAASGEGYFCDTASVGAFTVNLPSSPSVGDIVAIKDYASNFSIANLTIGRGGSNLNGNADDSVRNTDNESLTLVYADATKGWLAVEEGTGYVGENYISATGGTITCSGNDRIHTFTGPGTFTVSSVADCASNNIVSYVVVAGGGGGGNQIAGGGGAGGFREVKNPATPYTASPLDGYPTPGNRITVTATDFPITVGGGGAQVITPCAGSGPVGNPGSNSTFSTITSAGGGGGGGNNGSNGVAGGSGGGAGLRAPSGSSPGAGNTPPVTPAQGFAGGAASPGTPNPDGGGGGGGATAVGANYADPVAGAGGAGATTNITSSPVTYSGGGGGGGRVDQAVPGGAGGAGGGGNGAPGQPGNPDIRTGSNGTDNTGGGGGAGGYNGGGAAGKGISGVGGSGIVIIRYKSS